MFDTVALSEYVQELRVWLSEDVLVTSTLVQFTVVVAAFAVAWYLSQRLKPLVGRAAARVSEAQRERTQRAAFGLVFPGIWLTFLLVTLLIVASAELPYRVLEIATTLIGAWVIIRFASNLIRDPIWAKLFALIAWSVAALSIVGLLSETLAVLDGLAITFGELRLSALSLIKGVLTFILLLWLANFLSRVLSRRIGALPNLTPSVQVLTTNLLKILFVTVAVVASLSTLGIDLTAFAVFGGAVGVGLGFGLQKIVSNFVSGIIILLDRSVKPGDVIAIGNTFGWINSLNARYASVITRDGIEHLIPNEELITQRVENWSYSDELVRLRAPIGISYKSDVRKAMSLCLEATSGIPRILSDPKPVCLVKGFGDSSVDLELRFWVRDPQNGVGNVRSAVYLSVWDKFHEQGIEIPFPQRDLHIRSPEVLKFAQPCGASDVTGATE